MHQILYGVGSAVLREFTDNSKIVALTKLKNLSVEASSNEEKIFGGDASYPIAIFPKDKAIKITAENALFDMSMLNATQGADTVTGAVVFTEPMTVLVPTDGIVTLKYAPLTGSVLVVGYSVVVAPATPVAGTSYLVDETAKTITFAVGDAGKEVDIVYERTSDAGTVTMAVLMDTLAKPFKFIHRIPVYDDSNNVVGQAQLVIYKAKAANNFTFTMQPQTAMAPKLELEALDPKRPDGKLWDYSVEWVAAS